MNKFKVGDLIIGDMSDSILRVVETPSLNGRYRVKGILESGTVEMSKSYNESYYSKVEEGTVADIVAQLLLSPPRALAVNGSGDPVEVLPLPSGKVLVE